MNINFKVIEFNGRPMAIFDNFSELQKGILSEFFEEMRSDYKRNLILERVADAEQNGRISEDLTGDGVDIEIYPNHIVISELYPASGDEDDAENVELSLNDIKKLLLEWQKILSEAKV